MNEINYIRLNINYIIILNFSILIINIIPLILFLILKIKHKKGFDFKLFTIFEMICITVLFLYVSIIGKDIFFLNLIAYSECATHRLLMENNNNNIKYNINNNLNININSLPKNIQYEISCPSAKYYYKGMKLPIPYLYKNRVICLAHNNVHLFESYAEINDKQLVLSINESNPYEKYANSKLDFVKIFIAALFAIICFYIYRLKSTYNKKIYLIILILLFAYVFLIFLIKYTVISYLLFLILFQ